MIHLFFEFLRRERGSVDNLNIFRNLGGPGCAYQHTRSPLRPSGSRTAPSAPGSASVLCDFIQGAYLIQTFLRQRGFLQETAVPLNPAVLRNPVKVFIREKSLRQRTESDYTAAVGRCKGFQAVLFYTAVKYGISALVDDKRTLKV